MRFTNEQRNFRDAMKIMLDLYYKVKVSTGDGEKVRFSPDEIKTIAMLFHKTIPNFSPCFYFQKSDFFRFRAAKESISFNSPALGNSVEHFIRVMDALKDDISKGLRDIIIIHEANYQSNVRRDPKDPGYGAWFKNPAGHKERLRDHEWLNPIIVIQNKKLIDYIADEPSCKIQPPSGWQEHGDLFEVPLNSPPPYYESFHIFYNPDSSFWLAVKNQESPAAVISSPGYGKIDTDFTAVIKFIIIKYIALFGSFDSLKICKYQKCGKLFFEKYSGRKQFCGGTCRKRYHDEADLEKYHCRENQNGWLRARFGNKNIFSGSDLVRYNLYQPDCEDCTKLMNRGECPKLFKKNKEALKLIARHYSQKKKSLKK